MASFQKNVARCNEKKECLKSKVVPTVLQTTLIVKKCNLIDPNCLECSEDNKYCTKCKNNLYLYQNKCYEITNGLTLIKDLEIAAVICLDVFHGFQKNYAQNVIMIGY